MSPRSILEIDLAAVDHNVRVMRRMVGSHCKIGAIVKADAYGLGASRLAGTLQQAGVGCFIVFSPEEAESLLATRVNAPIVVLMPVCTWNPVTAFERAIRRGQVELVIHSHRQVELLARQARQRGCVLPIHLEIDTGMSRGGCGIDEAPALLSRIIESSAFELRGVMMHFAAADRDPDKTAEQTSRFDALLTGCRHLLPQNCTIHLSNSYATLRSTELHRTMVRIGSAWVGFGPEMMHSWDETVMPGSLRPVLTWRSRMTHVRAIDAGATVGYGGRWTARRPSRIGIIPVGYADGYHHALGATDAKPHGGVVRLNIGEDSSIDAPVVGAINMDQIAVDLTDAPDSVAEGGDVELISPVREAANRLTELARLAGTIPHVLLSQLHPRVTRTYVNEPAPLVEVKPTVGLVARTETQPL